MLLGVCSQLYIMLYYVVSFYCYMYSRGRFIPDIFESNLNITVRHHKSSYNLFHIFGDYLLYITTCKWCMASQFFFLNLTCVDTEMCCPKGKCGCQYVILLTLKKGVLDFLIKKLILDFYFCLKSGPVFLFQIFIIAPLPLPRDIQLYH